MQGYFLEFKANSIICREGDPSDDLFYLKSGRILICTVQGTHVKALARIETGDFIGELSFFDGKPRSSHMVAIGDCELLKIPRKEVDGLLPVWYLQIGKNLTKKIRLMDQIVQSSNLRRFGIEDQKPLTIEEQRVLYNLITHQDS